MNQVADILKLAQQAQQQNTDAVLATVVRTEGSAYRRAGAMMLICADGRSVGMISGGCIEPHIIKRAFWLTRHGASVQTYQTGAEQADDDGFEYIDDELNFGLGCNGRVHVLFERLATALPLFGLIAKVRQTQQTAVIATLIQSANPQHRIGMRINLGAPNTDGDAAMAQVKLIDPSQPSYDFERSLKQALAQLSAAGLSDTGTDSTHAEHVVLDESGLPDTAPSEWLIQRVQPQIRLLICGAGNDVMPLVTMAKLQDWHVTVIDSRPNYATRARFAQADRVLCLSLDDTEKLINMSDHAAVAVMSHSLAQDRARLAVLLAHPPAYLGQLGPRYRTERLIDEISATMSPARLARGIRQLHYPIGYKLGGDGPEALALSIMAQISAVMHKQPHRAVCDISANRPPIPAHYAQAQAL